MDEQEFTMHEADGGEGSPADESLDSFMQGVENETRESGHQVQPDEIIEDPGVVRAPDFQDPDDAPEQPQPASDQQQPEGEPEEKIPDVSPDILKYLGVEKAEDLKDVVDYSRNIMDRERQAYEAIAQARAFQEQLNKEKDELFNSMIFDPAPTFAKINMIRRQQYGLDPWMPSGMKQQRSESYDDDVPDLLDDEPRSARPDPKYTALEQKLNNVLSHLQQQQQQVQQQRYMQHQQAKARIMQEEVQSAIQALEMKPDVAAWVIPRVEQRIRADADLGRGPRDQDQYGNWTSDDAYREHFRKVAKEEVKRFRLAAFQGDRSIVQRQKDVASGYPKMAGVRGMTPTPQREQRYQSPADQPPGEFINEVLEIAARHSGSGADQRTPYV